MGHIKIKIVSSRHHEKNISRNGRVKISENLLFFVKAITQVKIVKINVFRTLEINQNLTTIEKHLVKKNG